MHSGQACVDDKNRISDSSQSYPHESSRPAPLATLSTQNNPSIPIYRLSPLQTYLPLPRPETSEMGFQYFLVKQPGPTSVATFLNSEKSTFETSTPIRGDVSTPKDACLPGCSASPTSSEDSASGIPLLCNDFILLTPPETHFKTCYPLIPLDTAFKSNTCLEVSRTPVTSTSQTPIIGRPPSLDEISCSLPYVPNSLSESALEQVWEEKSPNKCCCYKVVQTSDLAITQPENDSSRSCLFPKPTSIYENASLDFSSAYANTVPSFQQQYSLQDFAPHEAIFHEGGQLLDGSKQLSPQDWLSAEFGIDLSASPLYWQQKLQSNKQSNDPPNDQNLCCRQYGFLQSQKSQPPARVFQPGYVLYCSLHQQQRQSLSEDTHLLVDHNLCDRLQKDEAVWNQR
ncbi:unnamed protein product [Protopolystoma xenopodis]|uniref:Uncharacterized protein n=1 Tax=Protopolystoma xenopodis TaxID=117903 RepID=A0A448WFU2_9PLAT|nr:unnamed protein product [Protopolystoma xenopodis]